MITLHGSLDALLPIATDSDVYARVQLSESRRGGSHRYYTIAGGTRVDGLYNACPDRLQQILLLSLGVPRSDRLGRAPGRPTGERHGAEQASGDLVNSCALQGG